jgi:hypothetical protein
VGGLDDVLSGKAEGVADLVAGARRQTGRGITPKRLVSGLDYRRATNGPPPAIGPSCGLRGAAPGLSRTFLLSEQLLDIATAIATMAACTAVAGNASAVGPAAERVDAYAE